MRSASGSRNHWGFVRIKAYADVMLKAREAGAAAPTAASAPTSTKDSKLYVVLNMPLSKLEALANQYQVVIRPKDTTHIGC